MQRALTAILSAAVGLWAAAAAAADPAPPSALSASPNTALAPAHLMIDAKGAAGGFGSVYPENVTVALFKGFALDFAAAGRCQANDASAGTCPESSRIASGVISGNISLAGLFPQTADASVGMFLTTPASGALAGVVLELAGTGRLHVATGQIVGVNDPVFGYELRLDVLPPAMPPLGTTFTLTEFKLDLGASSVRPPTAGAPHPPLKSKHSPRRARRAHKPAKKHARKKHRATAKKATTTPAIHSLITNPATCPSSPSGAQAWPTEVRVRYADHTQTIAAPIACAP